MKESLNLRIGVLISYITLGVNVLISIFFTPYVLKTLGNDEYGLYSFVNSITSWLTILTSSLSAAYIRFATIENNTSGTPNRINSIYGKLFLILTGAVCFISVIVILMFFLGAIPLGNYDNYQKRLIIILFVISSLQVASTIFFSVYSLYNNYKKKFVLLRTLNLMVVVFNLVFTLISIVLGGNIIALALVHFIVNLLSLLINLFFALKIGFKFQKTKLKDNKILVKNIIIFSSFLLLNAIVDQINNSLDKTILGFMVNPEVVTVYELSQQFSTYLISMSIAISANFVPQINHLVMNGENEKYNNLFLKISKFQTTIIVFVVGGFAVSGLDFVNAWLANTGNNPQTVYILGLVLLIIYIVPLTENASIEIQRALNKHKFRSILYIAIAMLNVVISTILVYVLPNDFAVYGCLIGTVVSIVGGNWILINIYNIKSIKLPIKKYCIILILFLVLACACIGITYLLTFWLNLQKISNWLSFIVKAGVYSIIYFTILCIVFRKQVKHFLFSIGLKKH